MFLFQPLNENFAGGFLVLTVEDADGDAIDVELTDINPSFGSPFGEIFAISPTSATTCM